MGVADSIVAVDGAQEMLDINQTNLNSPRITYELANLFTWQPKIQYDLVFCAFWLSHVPPALLSAQLQMMWRAVKPGGRIFIVDEPVGGKQASGPIEGEFEQVRELNDGRKFRIVKTYIDYANIKANLAVLGFQDFYTWARGYFFFISATRAA